MNVEPITCSLTTDELRRDSEDLLPGLAAAARTIEWLPDAVRMEFGATEGILPWIARVLDRERVCCRFLRFEIDVAPSGGPIFLFITGPSGTGETLRTILTPLNTD